LTIEKKQVGIEKNPMEEEKMHFAPLIQRRKKKE
jgi:hypothetical protein